MLVACRLAGLSALEAYYAGGRARAQCGPTQSPIAASPRVMTRNAKVLRMTAGRVSSNTPQCRVTRSLPCFLFAGAAIYTIAADA